MPASERSILLSAAVLLAQLPELLGPIADDFETKLRALLQQGAEGRNVQPLVLDLIYSQPRAADWFFQALDSRQAGSGAQREYFTAEEGDDERFQFTVWSPERVSHQAWDDLLSSSSRSGEFRNLHGRQSWRSGDPTRPPRMQ